MRDHETIGRRPAIDVARVLALLGVVVGHLTLAVIDRGAGGDLRGANLLAIRPGWAWIAMLSPMAVFFAAAGWANAHATLRSSAPRLRSLIGLGAIVVSVWVGLAWVALLAGGGGVVADGARIATQPLWFLAAYVPLVAGAPFIARFARRPVVSISACLSILLVLDLARFSLGAPNWVGWPGFAAAWTVPWIIGTSWRARTENGGINEHRVGLALLLVAGLGAHLLVRFGGYSPALIDAIPGARSNTTPPTIYTAVAGMSQVGLLMVVAGVLDQVGRRWRRLLSRAGEVAVGVYVLHLSALALCAAVIALGCPVPSRLSAGWWISRPLWYAAVLAMTALLVWIAAVVRSSLVRRFPPRIDRPTPLADLWFGAALATIGGAVVGLKGPRNPVTAAVCVLAFVGSWWSFGRPGPRCSH